MIVLQIILIFYQQSMLTNNNNINANTPVISSNLIQVY